MPAPDSRSAILEWRPSFVHGRASPYPVVFTATTNSPPAISTGSTLITVNDVDRNPIARSGGPYHGSVGAPVVFDGSQSSDPDGDPIQVDWDFGDGASSSGLQVQHSYRSPGTFRVVLTVSDGKQADSDTTESQVGQPAQAMAFASGDSVISLVSSPSWCVQVEPINSSFSVDDIDASTVMLQSSLTGSVSEISVAQGKVILNGDRNLDSKQEMEACFLQDDLRKLFSNVTGDQRVSTRVVGSLRGGGTFTADLEVEVNGAPVGNWSSVSPNPLNPTGVLSFYISRPGPYRISLFDASGRRIRIISAGMATAAGYRTATISAHGANGNGLASGVYYYLVESRGGNGTGRFVILK